MKNFKYGDKIRRYVYSKSYLIAPKMEVSHATQWYSQATAGLEAWVWFYNTCFDWNEI